MKQILLGIFVIFVLPSIVSSSISCYVGSSGTYVQTSGFDVCYSWTTSGIAYKSGISGYTCSSSVPSGYSCCSTNLCNNGFIKQINIFLIISSLIIVLLRSI